MGTTFTPAGKPGSISLSFALTRSMTSMTFCPCLMMTIPDTTSPAPSRSETPRLRSGPVTTLPISLMRIGEPFSLAASTMFSKSWRERA